MALCGCTAETYTINPKPGEDLTRTKSVSWTLSDQTDLVITSPLVKEAVHIYVIADSHLWRYDERELPYMEYSSRMAAAYHKGADTNKHFRTGEDCDTEETLDWCINDAKEKNVDVILLLGDNVSYPSELSIERLKAKMDASGIPYLYTQGNHDWHYEGMENTDAYQDKTLLDLHDDWVARRYMSLYPAAGDVKSTLDSPYMKKYESKVGGKANPLAYAMEVKGLNILLMDDGVYGWLRQEQLDFWREIRDEGKPVFLGMHVPLYAPGNDTGWECGNPYSTTGNVPESRTFHSEFLNAENTIGAVWGHIHGVNENVLNGTPMISMKACYCGGYGDIWIKPE